MPLEVAAHETARLSEAGPLAVQDQPEGEMGAFGEREEELPQALVEAVGAENVQIPDLPATEDINGHVEHPAGQDLPSRLSREAEQLEEVLKEHGTALGAGGGRDYQSAVVRCGQPLDGPLHPKAVRRVEHEVNLGAAGSDDVLGNDQVRRPTRHDRHRTGRRRCGRPPR